jgi:TetR/AcrR family transcriptional repressor of nem operon
MSRGRTRSYDPDDVLDRVMRAFWRRGYAATSMRELREVTGLGSRSLYDDFGNKRELFRAALARYREEKMLRLYAPLREGESPLVALREFIARFEAHGRSDIRLGCLVGIGMAESVRGEDRVLANEIAALADEMRDRIKEAIRSAVERGELDGTIDPPELAALLFATLQGANLVGRVQPGGVLRADALSAARGLLDRFANATEAGSVAPQ